MLKSVISYVTELFVATLFAGMGANRFSGFLQGGIALMAFIERLKQHDFIVFNGYRKWVMQGFAFGTVIQGETIFGMIDGMFFQDRACLNPGFTLKLADGFGKVVCAVVVTDFKVFNGIAMTASDRK